MDNRWLIIPVEVKHREFHSRILLSALAAQRGMQVLLGKDTMIRRLAPALPKGIIFDKSLGLARHGKPQRFARLGHKVLVLDEESTGYYGSPDQFLSVRLSPETLEAATRWYCISETIRRDAVRQFPKYEDRFVTSGLLRTDVWRKPFHDLYKKERDRIVANNGPFILFNSNFGGIVHARGDAFVAKQIKGQKGAYSQVEERMARIFEQGKPNLDAFIKLLPKLCKWFPKHLIVIRPHPSERVDFWKNRFAGNDQIMVTNQGVATPWILASDMLVHHGCTTGIEAEILGKQHVMFAPHPDDHHDTQVMKAFAPIEHDETGLKSFIENNIAKPVQQRKGKDKSRYFENIEGKLVAETIMQDVEDMSFSSAPLEKRLPLNVRMRLWFADNKKRSDHEKAYMKQKWPGTSRREIMENLTTVADGLNISASFEVEEVFDEVFRIVAR